MNDCNCPEVEMDYIQFEIEGESLKLPVPKRFTDYIVNLKTKNAELEKKYAILLEAVEFYRDRYNWIESSMVNTDDWIRDGIKLKCGAKAREALKKIKEQSQTKREN